MGYKNKTAAEYHREWYLKNRERIIEKSKKNCNTKERYKTPYYRAVYLLASYNNNDKKYNRGKGDLTADWIVDNILFKPCVHCGKEGWNIIGCNRLDNNKPHTKDNVEPCCFKCNRKLA